MAGLDVDADETVDGFEKIEDAFWIVDWLLSVLMDDFVNLGDSVAVCVCVCDDVDF